MLYWFPHLLATSFTLKVWARNTGLIMSTNPATITVTNTVPDNVTGLTAVDPSKYADTLTIDFKPLSYENAKSNNYVGELGFDSNYPFAVPELA